ncbi:MAG: nucleotidyltransferase [Crocinitomicaceae bacterium]|nr:nucleotidyltransferase [Crocinitomicaceae bacterium]
MNLFIDKHQNLVSVLLKHNVDFLLIGGYAVIHHGYKRTTGDMDIWLKPHNDNKPKIIKVLKEVGVIPESIEVVATFDFTKHLVFSIWSDPEKVDFITRINLVEFEEANEQKIMADIDGLTIPIIHINHLVLSKFNTGRPQDAADIDKLQKIQELRKNL